MMLPNISFLYKKAMKSVLLFLSICLASGLLFTNIYNSLIDTKSWGSDIPNSITAAREYFKVINPGNFYRVFSPINQVLGLIVFIAFWKTTTEIRICLGVAFGMYIVADVLTFAYFYPRNDIMFKTAQLSEVTILKTVWSEWNKMNWIRSFVILIGLFYSCLSLHKIYIMK